MDDRGGPERGRWIGEVLERFEGPLTLYAHQLLRDADRARDVVQDTFLRLCRQPRRQIEGHLAEWLFTVCRHRALDLIRKDERMSTTVELEKGPLRSDAPGPDEMAEKRDRADFVMRAVDDLPERQREVLRLKFQHGLSYREISRVTELSVSNVGFLIHQALKAVRTRVGRTPSVPTLLRRTS